MSSQDPSARAGASVWRILAVWLLVMGLLYLAMVQVLRPPAASVTASGELQIPRARDGHFYAEGQIAGQPVLFLVDTGASTVVISEALARAAGLQGGVPTAFNTANGVLQGRMLQDVPVQVGPLAVSGVRVGVGLVGADAHVALLGQSFLAKFDLRVEGNLMRLRAR